MANKKMKKPNVEAWLEKMSTEQWLALERASKHLPARQQYDFHILQGIYGQESGFGENRGKKNTTGPAGDFQLTKEIAKKYGLKVTEKSDDRFDVNKAAAAAAKHIGTLDAYFTKETNLGGTKTIPITDLKERLKFAVAAYNSGEGRIAKAQSDGLPLDWIWITKNGNQFPIKDRLGKRGRR